MGSRKWSIVTTSLKKGRMSSILIRGHSSRNDMASFRSWFFVITCSAEIQNPILQGPVDGNFGSQCEMKQTRKRPMLSHSWRCISSASGWLATSLASARSSSSASSSAACHSPSSADSLTQARRSPRSRHSLQARSTFSERRVRAGRGRVAPPTSARSARRS